MRNFLLFILMQMVIHTGCATKGYVPHYILTDSPESKVDIKQLDEQEGVPSKEINNVAP